MPSGWAKYRRSPAQREKAPVQSGLPRGGGGKFSMKPPGSEPAITAKSPRSVLAGHLFRQTTSAN